MAQSVMPIDSVEYTSNAFDDLIEAIALQGGAAGAGVVRGMLNELAVTGAATPLAINTGWAIVKGKLYKNTASVDLAISTPAVSTRIDRVVLELDFTGTPVTCVVALVAGVEGGAAPALTQTDGTKWQISLAQASITTGGVVTLTDERDFLWEGMVRKSTLGADCVDGTKIEDDAVDSEHIVDGAIDTAHIGDSQVTAAKIANRTRRFHVPLAAASGVYHSASYAGWEFPNAATTTLGFHFIIPEDFVSGLKIRALHLQGGDSGTHNVVLQLKAFAATLDSDASSALADTGQVAEQARQNYTEASEWLSVTGTEVAVGAIVCGDFSRIGGAAGDTMTATMYALGIEVEYTADS